jgi:hypothetical protein
MCLIFTLSLIKFCNPSEMFFMFAWSRSCTLVGGCYLNNRPPHSRNKMEFMTRNMIIFIKLIKFHKFCWVFGARISRPKTGTNRRNSCSAKHIEFDRTQAEPNPAQVRTHARKHKENKSYALVQWRFDPRVAWKQPWIHGPTKERKWTELTSYPHEECTTHRPRAVSVEWRASKIYGLRPNPSWPPTHA